MSISEPAKITTPWASTGSKNPIPANANNATGAAGFDKGFPDITMTPEEAGGLPPAGQDFNGIFYEITKIIRYIQAGGVPTFSSSMSSAIGGYPKGAILLGNDGVSLYKNCFDGNSVDPNSNSAGWERPDLQIIESLRRTYLEAGYNLRPFPESFEFGGAITGDNDVLISLSTGKAYSGPISTVPPGTDPLSPGFVDRSGASLVGNLSSNNGATMIGGKNGYPVSTELDGINNRFMPTLFSSSNGVLTGGYGVVILGDSISAGAYCGNAWTNGWVHLLAKAVNHQFGATNVGAQPTDALYNVVPEYLTKQIHDVVWGGDWGPRAPNPTPYNVPLGNVGSAAGDAVNGKTVISTDPFAYMDVTVPSLNSTCTVFYVGRPGGGVLNITVNGAPAGTINTADTVVTYNKQAVISVPDGGRGTVNFRLSKADSNPTEIQSVIKYQSGVFSPLDHFKAMDVCNFSISGRQLARMSEAAIIEATKCGCLILALGYNDSEAETNATYYNDFMTRINWVIQYANISKCAVVVNDFAWYSAPGSKVRSALRKVAVETNGMYNPFPDRLYPNGSIPVLPPSGPSALVSDLRMWADNAHPDHKGNEFIFHETARSLGLQIVDREGALNADIPFPLVVQSGLRNKPPYISCASRTGAAVEVALELQTSAGAAIPAGTNQLTTMHPKMGVGTFFNTSKVVGVVGEAVKATIFSDSGGAVAMINTIGIEVENQITCQRKLI